MTASHISAIRLIANRLVTEATEARGVANTPGIGAAREHWLTKAEDFDEMAGSLRAIALTNDKNGGHA